MYGRDFLGGDPARFTTGRLGSAAAVVPAESTLLTDLFAYWLLNEASGTRADSLEVYTLSDTNTVGSATVAPVGVMTVQDSSIPERLENTSISVPNEFSFVYWVKTNSIGGSHHLMFNDASGNTKLYVGAESNNWVTVSFGDGAPSTADGGAAALNTLTMIAGGHDAAHKPWISINGAAKVIGDTDNGFSSAIARMYIGAQPGDTFPETFNAGRVGIWSRTITIDECVELYNEGAGKFYPFS